MDTKNKHTHSNGKFIIGNDTRSTSQFLVSVTVLGLLTSTPSIVLLREVTTPVVFYNMKEANRQGVLRSFLDDYFSSQINSFRHLLRFGDQKNKTSNKRLVFDGANGVGYLVTQKFSQKGLGDLLPISLNNGPEDGPVNLGCGSDHVIRHSQLPDSISLAPNQAGFTCDGDGDRVILFFQDQNNKLRILNGDKILALLCLGFKRLRDQFAELSELKIGGISTLYSDGNLKVFVETLGLPFYVEPTGVKNMFVRTRSLDISLLVEFNGHALVHFSDKARTLLLESEHTRELFSHVLALNCGAGDFMSIYFLLSFFMRLAGVSHAQVHQLFRDKVKKLLQVRVTRKNAVEMDERTGVHFRPEDLATFLEELMHKHQEQRLRIFVRKSGTEELVRILLEAECQKTIDQVSPLVEQFIVSHPQINPEQ